MNKREDYIFWKLANTFIADNDYRIIQLFENEKELWLEKLENKQAPIVRIVCQDLTWGNAMQRDIEFTAANGERVRKQLGKRNLQVLNIYISEFPPVDDFEERLNIPFAYPNGAKTSIHSILLAKDVYDTGFSALSNRLQKDVQFPVLEDYDDQDVESLKRGTLELAANRVKQERTLLKSRKPFFTYVFIVIQVVVFLWLQMNGGSTNTSTLIKYGAKVNQLIYDGQWWRLITPIFIHIGFLHLAMNTLSLYYMGIAVEQIFGRARFPFIYLFAGITGFIASFIFSSNLSAGASGAIFGCFGALLYFGVIFPRLFFRTMGLNLIVVLILNLVFGFSAAGIDNAGHLGGLAGGFLAAGIVHLPNKKRPVMQVLFTIISALIVWGSLAYGFSPAVKSKDDTSSLMMAQEYIKQKNYDEAYRILKDNEKNAAKPSDQTYFLLSYTEIKKGMLNDAKSHLQKAIQLNPKFDEAYFNLALINLEQNDLKAAKENAEQASKLDPNRKEYSDLINEITPRLQSSGEAE